VVENKPGANTQIGTAEVAKAPGDGHTLLVGGITPFVFNPLMYSKLPYDPKDLAGVAMLARSQLVLVAHPTVPANGVRELVDLSTTLQPATATSPICRRSCFSARPAPGRCTCRTVVRRRPSRTCPADRWIFTWVRRLA